MAFWISGRRSCGLCSSGSTPRSEARAALSVEPLRVQDVSKWLAAEVAPKVVAKDLGDPRVLLRDRAGGMRAQDDVGQVPERRILRRWVFPQHLERPARPTRFPLSPA